MNDRIFENDYIKAVTTDGGNHLVTKYLCPYCGKELKTKTIQDGFSVYDDTTEYMFCDCEDAIKEKGINYKIRELKYQLPKKKFKFIYSDENNNIIN